MDKIMKMCYILKALLMYLPNSLLLKLFQSYELYCDKETIDILYTFYFLGGLIGVLVFPYLADTKGRKWIMISTYLLSNIFLINLLISVNLNMIRASFFALGFFVNPFSGITAIYMSELGGFLYF
jgi:MFS family permease